VDDVMCCDVLADSTLMMSEVVFGITDSRMWTVALQSDALRSKTQLQILTWKFTPDLYSRKLLGIDVKQSWAVEQ
jgi:hypothetical protein